MTDSAKITADTSLIPLPVSSLKELKVAGVMDPFTATCFAPECQLLELTSHNWKQEIEGFQPHLLILESAWYGKDQSWQGKLRQKSTELIELTSWCRERQIPILYWGKEDPVDVLSFMVTAREADVVFTTDLDCVPTYRQHLQHNDVYFCHFAAQPKYHNPEEKYARSDKFCFAGSYYNKFAERCRLFEHIIRICTALKGVDIFDRNYGKNSTFPKQYQSLIRGTLSPQEIDKAYKGYTFGININSITESSTMFARRVFETMASNTVVISNYATGLKNVYGNLILAPRDPAELPQKVKQFCGDEVSYRKYRLLGLRKTLHENLYEDRFAFMAGKVFNNVSAPSLPKVVLFAACSSSSELERLVSAFKSQSYQNASLYVIGEHNTDTLPQNVHTLSFGELEKSIATFASGSDFLGVWSSQHYYGPNYLFDMLLTLRYRDVKGVGKANWYRMESSNVSLSGTDKTYCFTDSLLVDRGLFHASLISPSERLASFLNEKSISANGLFCVDEFNFCENCQETTCPAVDDMAVDDWGKSQQSLYQLVEEMKAGPLPPPLTAKVKTIMGVFKKEEEFACITLSLWGLPLYRKTVRNGRMRIIILGLRVFSRQQRG